MRHEKQTSKDFYKHSETGEIFCIERRWDGVLIGSCGPLALDKHMSCPVFRPIMIASMQYSCRLE